MPHYLSSKDSQLAQKYGLGTPIKRYQLVPTHFPLFLSPLRFGLFFLTGLLLCLAGLYIDISITLHYHLLWFWEAILPASCLPAACGIYFAYLGKTRLVVFNTLAAAISFFLVMLYNDIFRFPPPGFHLNDPLPHLLSGLFLQGTGWIIIWNCCNAILQPDSLLMCTEGCLTVNRLQRRCIIRWDSVVSLWNYRHGAKIVCNDGTQLLLRYRWTNAQLIRNLIYSKVFRHIRARTMEAYEAGKEVQFGKFTLSQLGISNGNQLFLWDHVYECEYLEDGVALIGRDDRCLDVASLRVLPNVAVFVSLVNARLTSSSPSTTFHYS